MKRRYLIVLFALGVWLRPASGEAQWDPIHPEDWKAPEGTQDAEMLFERITYDDRERYSKRQSFITIYQRLRIYTAEGRKRGDITLPILPMGQNFEWIRGRTILPDGQVVGLSMTQVFEKEVIRGRGVKVKQNSFSLPGMTDNCIIEYMVKYRQGILFAWLIQKDIPLRRGELHWLFAPKRAPSVSYIWLNIGKESTTDIEVLPPQGDPQKARFSIQNVPAYMEESYSPPQAATRGHLRLFSTVNTDNFWVDIASAPTGYLKSFSEKNLEVRKVVQSFSSTGSDENRISEAYDWIQANIRNISYQKGESGTYKDNDNADDVVKRGYGSTDEINYLFYTMLKEMGFNPGILFVTDRDEDLLIPEAKYWQFDGTLVAVGLGGYRYYAPGDLHLPDTHVPYYFESIRGLFAGTTVNPLEQLITVPFSPAETNQTRRTFDLRLDDGMRLSGRMTEERTGHSAREIRLLISQTAENERQSKLRETLGADLMNSQLTEVTVTNPEDVRQPVTLEGGLQLPDITQEAGARLLLQPMGFLKQTPNPFTTDTRRFSILFDYAKTRTDVIRIQMPAGWTPEALPADTTVANTAGQYSLAYDMSGQTLTVQRRFTITRPLWAAQDYEGIRRLFQSLQTMNAAQVVFKQKEP